MNPPENPAPDDVLRAEDLAVLSAFQGGSQWLRAVACTLARRGVAFRQAHPERAGRLLAAVSASPLYKGGQFLFDLLEWEDFMVDGPPPATFPTTLDAATLRRLAVFLNAVQRHLDSSVGPTPWETVAIEPEAPAAPHASLPPLEAGFYLYQDVVLGVVASAASLLASRPQ